MLKLIHIYCFFLMASDFDCFPYVEVANLITVPIFPGVKFELADVSVGRQMVPLSRVFRNNVINVVPYSRFARILNRSKCVHW